MLIETADKKIDDDDDYRGGFVIYIDGKHAASFFDGEPEDANLCRDFADVYNIVGMLCKAHAAGAASEPLVLKDLGELTSDELYELWKERR